MRALTSSSPRPARASASGGHRLAGTVVALLLAVVGLAGCSNSGTQPRAQANATGASTRPTGYSADPNATPPVITTTGGQISGVRTHSTDHYHDIPFAAPPVGMLRFAAPTPPSPWQGVRDGTRDAHPCVQNGPLFPVSSEDCLYLTVTRPAGAPANAKLPVIFWIHGGAFVGGAGDQTDPSAMAAAGPAIVVTTNYRLGPLGYLVLPSLIQQSGGDAGNYATQDLIAALRWTKTNAAAFGGDPTNVTIMGESAGSINVCALLASPSATGLFQKAIMESGPCSWKLPSMAQAQQSGLKLAARLGCVDAATADFCMRFKTAQQIMTAAADDTEIFAAFTFSPATGGKTLPITPMQALWNGTLADVPMLLGTVQDEGRPFTRHWDAGPITDAGVNGLIASHFPDRADRVLAAYPPGQVSPRERLARIITDSMFTCQATRFAQLTSGLMGSPTYLYEFDVPDAPPSDAAFGGGATHGWELSFLFPTDNSDLLTTPDRQDLSDAMIRYWTSFAATGDPDTENTATATRWPRFYNSAVHPGADRMLLTPEKIGPLSGTWVDHHCDVWS